MSSTPKPFSYGGQAVIEGVMMRGAHKFAVAVRNPQGKIVIHEQPLNAALYRGRVARTPFLRGLVGLWDALGLGTRALMWSADVALEEEDQKPAKAAVTTNGSAPASDSVPQTAEEKANSIFTGALGIGTVAVSLAFGVGLFFIFPTAAATAVGSLVGWQDYPLAVNLIEGVIQLTLLIAYLSLISLMPDVKRLFGYHGAEHKTINAYEAGAELTPEIVATYPIEHPRCGTAFLLTVFFISQLVFAPFGRPEFVLLILSRVILIPVIAGISYEFIRWTSKNMHRPLVRLIVIPNLALQHLTTRQPDLQMLEVAIASFKRVLVSESLLTEQEASPVPVTMSETSIAPGD